RLRQPYRPKAMAGCSIPVVLDAGGAQPGQAEAIDRTLPGEELVHRQRVALAGLFQAPQAPTHRCHDFRFAPYDPALGILGRKVGDRQRASVRPDDIAHPRPVLLIGHDTRYSFSDLLTTLDECN